MSGEKVLNPTFPEAIKALTSPQVVIRIIHQNQCLGQTFPFVYEQVFINFMPVCLVIMFSKEHYRAPNTRVTVYQNFLVERHKIDEPLSFFHQAGWEAPFPQEVRRRKWQLGGRSLLQSPSVGGWRSMMELQLGETLVKTLTLL